MADEDVHEADLQFENTDAGASTTYPNEAGKVRKGGHLVIRGRPCKARSRLSLVFSCIAYHPERMTLRCTC